MERLENVWEDWRIGGKTGECVGGLETVWEDGECVGGLKFVWED